jgi:signal transduction histidine kinase
MAVVSAFLVYMAQLNAESQIKLAASQTFRQQLVESVRGAAISTDVSLASIEKSLESAAESGIASNGNSSQVVSILNTVKGGSAPFSPEVFWIDSKGILRESTNQSISWQQGQDMSQQGFFKQARGVTQSFIAGPFTGYDGQQSIAVVEPISAYSTTFDGVLVAVIPISAVGNLIAEHTLSSSGDQGFLLVSTDGSVLLNDNTPFTGKNVLDGRFLDPVSADTKGIAGQSFSLMAQGRAGVFEFTNQATGQSVLVAYEPIQFMNNPYWAVASTRGMSGIQPLIDSVDSQRLFNIAAIVLIGLISLVFAIMILMFNRRLHSVVVKQDKQISMQLTDLKKAYDKLVEQDVLKDEFINIAAHELRTPVLPIMLSAEGLEEELGVKNAKVDIILRNARRINKLTNDILDVSRIESNTFKLQKDKIEIRKFIEEIIEDTSFKLSEEKKNLKLVLDYNLPNQIKEVSFDSARIHQVLVNLIDNAINYTESGTITIRVEISTKFPGFLEISVQDQGSGIDPAIKPRLFEKFATSGKKTKGTGLGLYLSKAIIEKHGGKIWAEDNAGGKGATFSFVLPIE